METLEVNPLRAVSVKQMAALPPYKGIFTEPALRALIHKSEPGYNSRGEIMPGNGLLEAGAIIRIGRRVLIDLDRFDSWVQAQRITA
jgi:hypothetical protein